LPCFLIHSKPVSGHFTIQIPVTDGGMFQLGAECLDAPIRNVVAHRLVDESAALAMLSHSVDGLYRGFWQADVDAFAHGVES
jgi:hypothetical protein